MKKTKRILAAGAAFLLCAAGFGANVDEVDPTIGTVAWLLQPTYPMVHLPHQMMRFHPYRADARADQIDYFPLLMCSHRWDGTFTVRTGDGPMTYDHEKTTPYHYSVWLEEAEEQLEFTPGSQSGCFRITAEQGRPVLQIGNRKEGSFELTTPQSFTAVETDNDALTIYVYGEFDIPVTAALTNGLLQITGTDDGKPVLLFRYGISYISKEQAEKNLRREIKSWNFDAQVAAGRERWNAAMERIQVKGGTAAQRRVFFTAFYRSCERMVDITEDGRYWSSCDKKVYTAERPFYVDSWVWDNFLTLEPLRMILNPEMAEDQIASYIQIYERTGWMPKFSLAGGPKAFMTGNHTAVWMADAWFKGLRNFDMQTAYEGNRKNTLKGTLLPWRTGPPSSLDKFHAENGFFPALHPGEPETEPEVYPSERRQAVAVTLDFAYDDWNLAQIARVLGHTADAEILMRRAANYRNVFRKEKQQMWPRDATGAWIEPFDIATSGGQGARDYFTENNGLTFNWLVRHDFNGLFELMGGRAAAEQKLDELFRLNYGILDDGAPVPSYFFFRQFPDSTGMVGQFSMGNEPSFHIPYLYTYLGSPWKTQKRIRMLLNTWFMDNVFGIPGDEDGGTVSAWAVFSMMGFYPAVPGVPLYVIGCPSFEEVTLALPNGKTFTVAAPGNSPENKYIQRVSLNGRPLNRLWILHRELTEGGTLTLEMGPRPNKTLGSRPEDIPPSSLNLHPEALDQF
ncbi:MAG: GH92 family glycosyl hydrolase [Pontiellaceae bacterium]|jgi:predicted alpha-1,2-mannosidase|nr:GH92 family glycosyl hydrolase [Pontiellaceae bacterium]